MTRIKRIALLVVAALAAFYSADYLVARKQPLGSVEVQPFYAVPQRNGKTEILMLDSEDENCVQSLLPHRGMSPCWYLRKHTQKRIDM